MHVVWYKRDLRVYDHEPLANASKASPVLCLYVIEPEVIHAPDFDHIHWQFIVESLTQLDHDLRQRGGYLLVLIGSMPAVLDQLHSLIPITRLHSTEETGNGITYDRDKRVLAWAKRMGVPWQETPSNGVVRRLDDRNRWSLLWRKRMSQSLIEPPEQLDCVNPAVLGSLPVWTPDGEPLLEAMQVYRLPRSHGHANSPLVWPSSDQLNIASSGIPGLKSVCQLGGEYQANVTLQTFFSHRGLNYQSQMSSPTTADVACSRISPYLAFGCLSIRQVVQATRLQLLHRQEALDMAQLTLSALACQEQKQWIRSLRSFERRLHWHCHFIQKLESEPELEFQNTCRAFDGLRESLDPDLAQERFEAWKAGQTGFPMIDACMRYLHEHRWINFRMRAMLMSFAAYHLWLHWVKPAHYLATQFLDYEPGIHYPQCHMQSGVTGINSIRIYSPVKQAKDQDPTGEFIRQYVPELAGLDTPFIHQPEMTPPLIQLTSGLQLGQTYPLPIVDHQRALKEAKEAIWAIKRQPETKAMARQVFERHGSRVNNRT